MDSSVAHGWKGSASGSDLAAINDGVQAKMRTSISLRTTTGTSAFVLCANGALPPLTVRLQLNMRPVTHRTQPYSTRVGFLLLVGEEQINHQV
jgi:hypothetical protein